MRICYLGPEDRQSILQGYAGPEAKIEARHPGSRAALESAYDEYAELPAQLAAIRCAEADGFNAVIIGCFGDPGIDAAREAVSIPVIGVGETALTIAAMLGTRFGVLTPLGRLLPATLRQIRSLGLSERLAHIEPVEIPIMVIRRNPARSLRLMLAGADVCRARGAESLALACSSMSCYAERIQHKLGIPVINGLRVAVRFAELLVASNLTFSKRSYPFPDSLREQARSLQGHLCKAKRPRQEQRARARSDRIR